MTISDRIFDRLKQSSMTQKDFAKKTGIKQSTISEWKKNKTNPSSDKILGICEALEVSPEWLLSGVDSAASRKKNKEFYVVGINTEIGFLIEMYNSMEKTQRDWLIGYLEAMNGSICDN